jgi:hypothetical protein
MTLDRGAVVWGVVFILLGAVYLLDSAGVWTVQLAYLWPGLLIAAGLALAATALTDRTPR